MDIWFYVGIFLFIWLIYDLIRAKTYFHREFDRKTEKKAYWFIWFLWLVVAIFVLFTSQTFILYIS